MPSAEVYARFELISEINGGRQLVFLRPNASDLTAALDGVGNKELLSRLVSSCCRVTSNGEGKLTALDVDQLDAADSAEVFDIVLAILREADDYNVTVRANGLDEPIVYDLRYPVLLHGRQDGEVVRQIQFQARKVGEITNFIDSRGVQQKFYTFMRGFGSLLGTQLPMADAIIGAIDFLDYLVIAQHIMGKLTAPRGRWSKISSDSPSASVGRLEVGTS